MWDANFQKDLLKYSNTGVFPQDFIDQHKHDVEKYMSICCVANLRDLDLERRIVDLVRNNDFSTTLFRTILSYCNKLGSCKEIEDAFIERIVQKHSFFAAVGYSEFVLCKRWPRLESELLYALKNFESIGCFLDWEKSFCRYLGFIARERLHDLECEIFKHKNLSIMYSLSLFERIKEVEDILLKQGMSKDIIHYIARCMKYKRWPEAEHLITDPQDILWYCEFVLHDSWEEKEELISKDSKASIAYAKDVLKGPFQKAEKNILCNKDYFDYFVFSTESKKTFLSQLNQHVKLNPNISLKDFAEKFSDFRDVDFERTLLSSTHTQTKAVWYAANVLKDRWPEAEERIKKSAKNAVTYARDVIKGRWLEAENVISRNPKYLSQYGIEVIKGKLPGPLHKKMLAYGISKKSKEVKKYFDFLEEESF